jgi:hypothetical protein
LKGSTALAALALLLLALLAPPAAAHKPSDSYLSLASTADAGRYQGRWDIALRDLDEALALDADGNGEITWGEVRARHDEIARYALARLELRAGGRGCTLAPGAPQQIVAHTDGAYTVLPFVAQCEAGDGGAGLEIGYRLFADLDPQHRGLLALTLGTGTSASTRTAVLTPGSAAQRFDAAATGRWQQALTYIWEGVWHIWIGLDHILFLVSLLLPAVLVRAGQPPGWVPVARFAPAAWEVVRVVTAFTVAHSITLSLATLGVIELPSRLVESVIAASVVLAALNNIWPVVAGRRWVVAFVFGLIHGFGFASVLGALGLPADALLLALVAFNVGVELGQLAIVAVFLPLAYALRHSALYRRGLVVGGSLLIAALASVWLAERAFSVKLLGL